MLRYVRGLALLSILFFMLVFVMLSLFLLQTQRVEIKTIAGLHNKSDMTLIAENKLSELARTFPQQTACLFSFKHISDLVKMTEEQWRRESCSENLNSFQYYYRIEFLGIDPCGRIGKRIASYYRLSLLLFAKNSNEKTLLQTTEIIPQSTATLCRSSLHDVMPGRQSWRQIF